jgi:hypothetical protein
MDCFELAENRDRWPSFLLKKVYIYTRPEGIWRSGSLILPIPNLGVKGRRAVSLLHKPIFSWETNPTPNEKGAAWTPKRVWMFWSKIYFFPTP